jgi:hypothetical protein
MIREVASVVLLIKENCRLPDRLRFLKGLIYRRLQYVGWFVPYRSRDYALYHREGTVEGR